MLLRDGRPRYTTVLSQGQRGGAHAPARDPPDQIAALRVLPARYQQFRRARARLGKGHRPMVAVIGHLDAARRKDR